MIADAESNEKRLPEIPEIITTVNTENEAATNRMENGETLNLAAVPEESELPEQHEPNFLPQSREPEDGARRSKRTT